MATGESTGGSRTHSALRVLLVLALLYVFLVAIQTIGGTVKGLGLGLPMVKLALEAMGAELEVHSRLQEGTCFTIRL